MACRVGKRPLVWAALVITALASTIGSTALADGTTSVASSRPLDGATERMALGRRYFEVQQYDQAIREFQSGYLTDPDPEFLYGIAQAQRLKGDCGSAIAAYRGYLEASAGETSDAAVAARRANAQAMLERCLAAPAAPARAPASSTTSIAMSRPATSRPVQPALLVSPTRGPEVVPRSGAHWYSDALVDSLAGVAGAGLIGGGVLLFLGNGEALSAESAANQRSGYQEYIDDANAATRDRLIGGLAMGAGLVCSGGALIVHLVRGHRATEAAQLSATPLPGGAALGISGAF